MKKVRSALILSTLALLATGPAWADLSALNAACGGVPAAPTSVPGDTADEAAMRTYGAGMRDYTAKLMTYLTCLDNSPVSSAELSSAAYRREVIAHRRSVADQLESTVTRFNAELRSFKAAHPQVAAVQ